MPDPPSAETSIERPLQKPPHLPRAFRGYDCTATDKLLFELEESFYALSAERDRLKERVAELEAELAGYRQQR